MKTFLSGTAALLLATLAFLLVIRFSTRSSARNQAESVAPVLSSLIDTVSVRLSLADRIALSKLHTRFPVEDAQREQIVLNSVAAQVSEYNLDPLRARRFFSSQIEANKLIQYGLLWKWSQAGQVPSESHPDLNAVRSDLDRIQKVMLRQLSRFEAYRKDTRCRHWVSSAVARHTQDELHQWALVRATGGLCD